MNQPILKTVHPCNFTSISNKRTRSIDQLDIAYCTCTTTPTYPSVLIKHLRRPNIPLGIVLSNNNIPQEDCIIQLTRNSCISTIPTNLQHCFFPVLVLVLPVHQPEVIPLIHKQSLNRGILILHSRNHSRSTLVIHRANICNLRTNITKLTIHILKFKCNSSTKRFPVWIFPIHMPVPVQLPDHTSIEIQCIPHSLKDLSTAFNISRPTSNIHELIKSMHY